MISWLHILDLCTNNASARKWFRPRVAFPFSPSCLGWRDRAIHPQPGIAVQCILRLHAPLTAGSLVENLRPWVMAATASLHAERWALNLAIETTETVDVR
jgi:hypothetical protein